MNIYYHLSHYVSHRTAGMDYIEAIKSIGYSITDDHRFADIIILHDDPLNYRTIIRSLNNPPKDQIITYNVWETEQLPAQYIEPLALVDKIWTCSDFSSISFSKVFSRVNIVPHIVGNRAPREQDIAAIKKMIHHSDDAFYFLTVSDSINPRKNISGLLDVFMKHFRKMPNVFLVVKQYRQAFDLSSLPQIISINNHLSSGEMAALHAVCDCYVSLHHAEAWGLSISDALSAGNPVIATGYSGNMHYMNEKNSFPVNFTVGNIFPEMCKTIPLYTENMTWAYPDLNHAAYLMKKCARNCKDEDLAESTKRSMERFNMENVSNVLAKLLCK